MRNTRKSRNSKPDFKGWIVMGGIVALSFAFATCGNGCGGEDPQCGALDNPCPTTDGGVTTDDGGKQDTGPVPDGGTTGDSACVQHAPVNLYDGGGICTDKACDCHKCDTFYSSLYNASYACTLHDPADPSRDYQFTATLNPSSTTYYTPFWAYPDGCYVDFGKICQCLATPDMMTAQVIECQQCEVGEGHTFPLTCTRL